jgi:hypothetical protein
MKIKKYSVKLFDENMSIAFWRYVCMRLLFYEVTQSNVVFKWTPDCHSALEKVKALVKADVELTRFDPNGDILIECNASNRGISGKY